MCKFRSWLLVAAEVLQASNVRSRRRGLLRTLPNLIRLLFSCDEVRLFALMNHGLITGSIIWEVGGRGSGSQG